MIALSQNNKFTLGRSSVGTSSRSVGKKPSFYETRNEEILDGPRVTCVDAHVRARVSLSYMYVLKFAISPPPTPDPTPPHPTPRIGCCRGVISLCCCPRPVFFLFYFDHPPPKKKLVPIRGAPSSRGQGGERRPQQVVEHGDAAAREQGRPERRYLGGPH